MVVIDGNLGPTSHRGDGRDSLVSIPGRGHDALVDDLAVLTHTVDDE